MIDNSFCLRSIFTVCITVAPLLFPLLRHSPLVTLYKPLHIRNFYPRDMQCLLNLTVVESKRQVRWFRNTENVRTQTLKTPTPCAVFQRVQSTHIYVLYFHPRSAEYCKVCHLCCWQFMFAAFWWGPTLCLLVEVNAFFLMSNCALLLMIVKSFGLPIFIIFYITSPSLLLTLFGHRPLASLYESLRNGTFYPPDKIALMFDSVTVGYCFLFAPKYNTFPHLLSCWFVIIVLRTARKLQTLTKYVAYYWLRVVRSVNSSISKWLLPSDILNYTTSNHSLILSRKFDKFRVSSFWRLLFRGYFIAFSVMAVFFMSLVW